MSFIIIIPLLIFQSWPFQLDHQEQCALASFETFETNTILVDTSGRAEA
jgi:hypothetical protein